MSDDELEDIARRTERHNIIFHLLSEGFQNLTYDEIVDLIWDFEEAATEKQLSHKI